MESLHPLESWLGRGDDALFHLQDRKLLSNAVHQASHAWSAVRSAATSGNSPAALNDCLPHLQFLRAHRFFLQISEVDVRGLIALLTKLALSRKRGAGSDDEVEQNVRSITSYERPEKPASGGTSGQGAGGLEECCFLLLAVWVQRLARQPQSKGLAAKQLTALLEASVLAVSQALLWGQPSPGSYGAGVLFLGAASAAKLCPELLRDNAQKAILSLLVGEGAQSLREVLAGVGYAMSASHGNQLSALFGGLLCLWVPRASQVAATQSLELPPLEEGLLLLRLMDYESSRLRSVGEGQWPAAKGAALSNVQTIARVCRQGMERAPLRWALWEGFDKGSGQGSASIQCAAIMAVAGILRGLCRRTSRQPEAQMRQGASLIISPDWELEVRLLQDLVCEGAKDACPWEIRPMDMEPGLRTSDWIRVRPGIPQLPARPDCQAAWQPHWLSWASSSVARHVPGQSSQANEEVAHAREARHRLRCVALAVSRLYGAGMPGMAPHPSILWSLAAALWGDSIQLGQFHSTILAASPVFQGNVTERERQTPSGNEFSLATLGQGFDSGVGFGFTEGSADREGATRTASEAIAKLEEQVAGLMFREAPALARAFCEQFRGADRASQFLAVQAVREYTLGLYQGQRLVELAARTGAFSPVVSIQLAGSRGPTDGAQKQAPTSVVRRVLGSAFLSVCIFLTVAVPDRREQGKASGSEQVRGQPAERHGPMGEGLGGDAGFAVDALEVLALLEFSRVQVAVYGPLVQRVVEQIASSPATVEALVQRMPRYEDLFGLPGVQVAAHRSDMWTHDEVQTKCVHFWLRVLQPCLPSMPPQLFAYMVAPTMFLYLHHPQEEVSLSAHSLFAGFLKTTYEASQGQRDPATGHLARESFRLGGGQPPNGGDTLTEQLTVHYTERALQGFPAVTPFKGLVSGVGAIAMYLPAGSPACAMCLRAIGQRSFDLLSKARSAPSSHPSAMPGLERASEMLPPGGTALAEAGPEERGATGRPGEGAGEFSGRGEKQQQQQQQQLEEEEGGRKLRSLLMHLIPVVDLQILPVALQEVARLLLRLSAEGDPQKDALKELYEVLAASDDYTRKPFTVPFFQSLSYLVAAQAAVAQRASAGGGGSGEGRTGGARSNRKDDAERRAPKAGTSGKGDSGESRGAADCQRRGARGSSRGGTSDGVGFLESGGVQRRQGTFEGDEPGTGGSPADSERRQGDGANGKGVSECSRSEGAMGVTADQDGFVKSAAAGTAHEAGAEGEDLRGRGEAAGQLQKRNEGQNGCPIGAGGQAKMAVHSQAGGGDRLLRDAVASDGRLAMPASYCEESPSASDDEGEKNTVALLGDPVYATDEDVNSLEMSFCTEGIPRGNENENLLAEEGEGKDTSYGNACTKATFERKDGFYGMSEVNSRIRQCGSDRWLSRILEPIWPSKL